MQLDGHRRHGEGHSSKMHATHRQKQAMHFKSDVESRRRCPRSASADCWARRRECELPLFRRSNSLDSDRMREIPVCRHRTQSPKPASRSASKIDDTARENTTAPGLACGSHMPSSSLPQLPCTATTCMEKANTSICPSYQSHVVHGIHSSHSRARHMHVQETEPHHNEQQVAADFLNTGFSLNKYVNKRISSVKRSTMDMQDNLRCRSWDALSSNHPSEEHDLGIHRALAAPSSFSFDENIRPRMSSSPEVLCSKSPRTTSTAITRLRAIFGMGFEKTKGWITRKSKGTSGLNAGHDSRRKESLREQLEEALWNSERETTFTAADRGYVSSGDVVMY